MRLELHCNTTLGGGIEEGHAAALEAFLDAKIGGRQRAVIPESEAATRAIAWLPFESPGAMFMYEQNLVVNGATIAMYRRYFTDDPHTIAIVADFLSTAKIT